MSPEVSRELSGPTSLVVDGETEVWGRGGGREQASSALPGLLWQSDSLVVCEVDPELKEKLRKFRFRKETDNAAIISECHLLPWKDGREGGDKEVWASVTSGWEGRLTPVCHLFPVKVDKDRQMVVLEEEFQNISPEELKTELPERQPRFVVYSYKYVHEDGRVSYPLCFIFSSPVGEAQLSTCPRKRV